MLTFSASPLADASPPVVVRLRGMSYSFREPVILSALLAHAKVVPQPGRLLDLNGTVFRDHVSEPVLLVNNKPATLQTVLHGGDAIEVGPGTDQSEPTAVETIADGQTNPMYVLGNATVERRRGLISDRTAVIGRRPGVPQMVALTFDDGPDPRYTPAVLDILKQYGIKATFFALGINAARHQDLIARIRAEGHQVGDHSWNHPKLGAMPADEVRGQLISAGGKLGDVTVFRPPYGHYTPDTVAIASSLGLRTILWDVDPADYRKPGVGPIVDRVLAQTRPGSIILLHDGGGDRSQTVAALRILVPELGARGYAFSRIG